MVNFTKKRRRFKPSLKYTYIHWHEMSLSRLQLPCAISCKTCQRTPEDRESLTAQVLFLLLFFSKRVYLERVLFSWNMHCAIYAKRSTPKNAKKPQQNWQCCQARFGKYKLPSTPHSTDY
jgi:hypothetical protein